MNSRKDNLFNRFLNVLIGASFLLVIICVWLQVISRYVFRSAFVWTEELSLFAFCYLTFLGGASCSGDESHIEVDFFYNRLPSKIRHVFKLGILVIISILSLFLVYASLLALVNQVGISSVALRIPVGGYTLAIAVSSVCIFLFSIIRIIEALLPRQCKSCRGNSNGRVANPGDSMPERFGAHQNNQGVSDGQ